MRHADKGKGFEIVAAGVFAGLVALLALWLWPDERDTRSRTGSIVAGVGEASRPAGDAAASTRIAGPGVELQELYLFDDPRHALAVVRTDGGAALNANIGTVLPGGAVVEAIGAYGVDLVRGDRRWRLAETPEARHARLNRPPDALPPRAANDL